MELLYSNIKPCESDNSSFSEAFELGVVKSDAIKIATGYISEESILELKSILSYYLDSSSPKKCQLIIGMHGREGFTRPQWEATLDLANFLKDQNIGSVCVCTAFKFHGKVYSFYHSGMPFSAVVGSSNLNNLVENRQWEVDALLTELNVLTDLDTLHSNLINKACRNFLDLEEPHTFNSSQNLLKDRIGVKRVEADSLHQTKSSLTGRGFELPLKSEPKSNLNAYFGKGRLASATGAIRPRHWYEVELIVPKEMTMKKGYPAEESVIDVYTDDGWEFKCKISGQNGKNFRSEHDLRTLGRWIKGRLETAGCLKVGQHVTESVLDKYGRHTISLRETATPNLWMLDFSR